MLSHGRAEGGWLSESLTQGLRKYPALGPSSTVIGTTNKNQFLKPLLLQDLLLYFFIQLLETVS